MRIKILLQVLMLAFFINASAQFRKYSNEFLNIGAGARALGMGGANIASVRDGTSGYWNPANIALIKEDPSLSLMHAEYFAGIGKYDFAGIAIPVKNSGRSIGFSLMRFGIDDIPNTLFLVEPDGTVNYNNIETFSSADYAFLFSMGQVIKENEKVTISVGGNAKIIHRNVGSFAKAWGFGLDGGVTVAADKWKLAAVLRDATTTFNTWSFSFTEREKEVLYMTNNDIPEQSTELTAPRLILGGAYRFDFSEKLSLLTEASFDMTFDGKRNTLIKTNAFSIDPRAGLEVNYNDIMYLRGGVSNFQQALKDGDTTNLQKVWIFQPALGAGFRINNVGIDYAFTNLANQTSPLYTHVVSLNINLRRKER
jgi:hypothetical protein